MNLARIQRILVALDESPRAPLVLGASAAFARALGARMRLFRAVPIQPEVPWDLVSKFPPGGLAALLSQRAQADLEARARDLPPGLIDGIEVEVGTPYQKIVEAARVYGADIIMVGSHGYSGLDRLVGTTAEKVVSHADRPVLVLR